ncbi:hypothetical protein DSC45_01355 [Streptomyces sp. YIM 130001]|uniref:hypothetical protein n=1 Tax=Streptomyces sp. YIM 130001 TaxID=2259644 RepID=UPI000E648A45|nr:hypothetical protein [Streptomyces sp. YIM 130001]RII21037.1 hypothetical protein DSC45_01355 [Streptomyces sp. YIM 130001]
MAVQGTVPQAHEGGCTCGDCPHGAREGHRRAVASFVAARERLAGGAGLPAALAHSPGASRQWVSDELTQAAVDLASRSKADGEAWLRGLWRRTATVVWGAVVALVLTAALTGIGAGWTAARTSAVVAAVVVAAALTAGTRNWRTRGGALALLVGDDNRLSTSRSVAAGWVLLLAYALLLLATELLLASSAADRTRLLDGLAPARCAALLAVFAVICTVAVLVRRIVALRVAGQRLQKVSADRPRAADLLTDDAGRASFGDVQYAVVSTAALVLAAVSLARQPGRLPDLPWGPAILLLVSTGVYLAAKFAEGGRPVIHAVVRAREPGDLDAPIRTGDDIEIRGAGFVPPGARTPDRLARLVVRIGAVHAHVPLVPVPGGFANPTDAVLTVPVPAYVEPGLVDVQVVTASGAETNRCTIDVTE